MPPVRKEGGYEDDEIAEPVACGDGAEQDAGIPRHGRRHRRQAERGGAGSRGGEGPHAGETPHRPPDLDDFRVVTPAAISDLAQSASGTLKTVLIAVTSISLVVGGIVLMNVMLLAVTERRREIGVRRTVRMISRSRTSWS